MNISKILHQTASEYSTFAMMAKAKGQLEESKQFFKQAFELEQAAVLQLQTDETDPLFPFILKRSAAALAYKSGFYAVADKLVVDTLRENPPAFISIELNEIANLIQLTRSKQGVQESFQINGKLTSANESTSEIKVEDIQSQQHYAIFVPTDKIKEVVKKFFSESVKIQAVASINGDLTLKEITSTV